MSEGTYSLLERGFAALPFGTSPIGRIVLCGGAGAAYAVAMRPSLSFDDKGAPRPWIFLDSKNPEATVWPWWAYAVVPAVLFGVLL